MERRENFKNAIFLNVNKNSLEAAKASYFCRVSMTSKQIGCVNADFFPPTTIMKKLSSWLVFRWHSI